VSRAIEHVEKLAGIVQQSDSAMSARVDSENGALADVPALPVRGSKERACNQDKA